MSVVRENDLSKPTPCETSRKASKASKYMYILVYIITFTPCLHQKRPAQQK